MIPFLIVLVLLVLSHGNWGFRETLFAATTLIGLGLWTVADVSYSWRTGDWGMHYNILGKRFWTQALEKTHRTPDELWLSRLGRMLYGVGIILFFVA